MLGRTATPDHPQKVQEHFENDEEGLQILPPRKINSATIAVNDEMVADPGEILSLSSSSGCSLEMAGDSSSSQTGREEELHFGAQKVSMPSSTIRWIILVVFQAYEDISGLFSDPESSP